MILKVLVENTSLSDDLLYEHGLSFYIETKNHKILFDMGQSDAFIKNARTLGVELENVDIAFLSHGHYDHGGGLNDFLSINPTARIYINKNAFGDYYNADGRYLGLEKTLGERKGIIFTDDELVIDDELYLFTGNDLERKHQMDTFGLFKKENEELAFDDFSHEQYLIIKAEDKNILISGCSHKGILNIMEWVKDYEIRSVFGGFHYMKLDTEKDSEYLSLSCQKLLESGAKFYTCHCTGTEQYNFMKEKMNKKLEYIPAGSVIEI